MAMSDAAFVTYVNVGLAVAPPSQNAAMVAFLNVGFEKLNLLIPVPQRGWGCPVIPSTIKLPHALDDTRRAFSTYVHIVPPPAEMAVAALLPDLVGAVAVSAE